MSMGTAKIQRLHDGRINRTPQKPLNPIIKDVLLATLDRKDIFIIKSDLPGSTRYEIREKKRMLFAFDSAYKHGYYSIEGSLGSKQPIILAEMDWFKNDKHTNSQQQDILDVLESITDKEEQLTHFNQLSNSEKIFVNNLQRSK